MNDTTICFMYKYNTTFPQEKLYLHIISLQKMADLIVQKMLHF